MPNTFCSVIELCSQSPDAENLKLIFAKKILKKLVSKDSRLTTSAILNLENLFIDTKDKQLYWPIEEKKTNSQLKQRRDSLSNTNLLYMTITNKFQDQSEQQKAVIAGILITQLYGVTLEDIIQLFIESQSNTDIFLNKLFGQFQHKICYCPVASINHMPTASTNLGDSTIQNIVWNLLHPQNPQENSIPHPDLDTQTEGDISESEDGLISSEFTETKVPRAQPSIAQAYSSINLHIASNLDLRQTSTVIGPLQSSKKKNLLRHIENLSADLRTSLYEKISQLLNNVDWKIVTVKKQDKPSTIIHLENIIQDRWKTPDEKLALIIDTCKSSANMNFISRFFRGRSPITHKFYETISSINNKFSAEEALNSLHKYEDEFKIHTNTMFQEQNCHDLCSQYHAGASDSSVINATAISVK